MSLRDALLASREAKTVTLTPTFLPLNGDGPMKVDIIMMSVVQRRDLLRAAVGADGQEDQAALQAAIAIATVRDPVTKQMVFTSADRDALMQWPAGDLDELTAPAIKLNKLNPDAVADAEKNSTATPSA
jgi:hypothetical protein